ncbi:MAG: hypothetical protein OXU20_32735 [Myxococcales bacterium]|nr:hypothetical protein [Myxococcales bacterium]
MKMPSPVELARMVTRAWSQREQWERASDTRLSASDQKGLVEVELYLKTNRFEAVRTVREASTQAIAEATLEACNLALQRADRFWQTTHDALK